MRFLPARGSRPFFSYLPSFLLCWASFSCDVRFVHSQPCGKAETRSKCEGRYMPLPAPHFWLWPGPLSFLGCTSLGGPPRAPCNMGTTRWNGRCAAPVLWTHIAFFTG